VKKEFIDEIIKVMERKFPTRKVRLTETQIDILYGCAALGINSVKQLEKATGMKIPQKPENLKE